MEPGTAAVRISLTTSIYCLVRNAGPFPALSEPLMTDRIHLVVATPCFGGQVSSIYANSIFQLQRAIRAKSNMELKVLLRDGDALITRARANLVTLFPRRSHRDTFSVRRCRYRFYPEQVFRLIESGADVVAGIYPIKRVNWDKAKRMLETRRPGFRRPRWTMCWRSTIPIMSPSSTALRGCATPARDS